MIRISASQLRTHLSCKRKWYHEKVMKLPVRKSGAQTFGTVLHAVCERYLLADDRGYDENGEPVDLYPPGWEYSLDWNGEPDGVLTPEEQATVRTLVAKGIEEGVLERQKGRSIEHRFEIEVIPGVTLLGFIDVLNPHRIEDHKTTSNMRYAESKNSLGKNLQMLVYAYYAITQMEEMPKTFWLRHNIYCKQANNLRVRKVEVEVDTADVIAHWNDVVVPAAKEMLRLKTEGIENPLEDLPNPPVDTCNAYGGCPFLRICDGKESYEQYAKRLDEAEKFVSNLTVGGKPLSSDGSGDNSVSALKKRLESKKRVPREAPKDSTADRPSCPDPTQQDGKPDLDPLRDESAPPWAWSQCSVCGGTGFNSKGLPCRICDLNAKETGQPRAEEFDISVNEDGDIVWADKDGTVLGSMATKASEVEVKADAREKGVEPVEEPVEEPAEEPAPKPKQRSVETAVPKVSPEPPARRGRPKKGFVLCINCVPIKGIQKSTGRGVYYGYDILEQIYRQIEKEAGVETFHEVDAFVRREKIGRIAVGMVEEFKHDMVAITGVTGGSTDMKALLDALRPHAGMEIMGSFA
jgi:hypothetical protein